MKKTLIALGTLAAFAGAASAQSNVTLFGVVDQSLNSVKNGSLSFKKMDSNQLSSNRFGVRGEEDLGGGLKAAFWLEAGMNTEAGAVGGNTSQPNSLGTGASSFFNRRFTMSLIGSFGELRIGRDYNPQFWNTVFGDVNGANGIGEGLNLINTSLSSGATTFARANNGIYYFLPSGLGGLYGHFGVSIDQGATSMAGVNVPGTTAATNNGQTGNAHRSARIGYASGPLEVAVSFGRTDVCSSGTAANCTGQTALIAKGYNSGSFNVFNAMANYDLGVAKLYSFYNRNTFSPAKQSTYEISAGVPVATGEFRISYGKQDSSGLYTTGTNALAAANLTTGTSTLFGTSYVHNLSKRSMVYVGYGRISNSNNAAFRVLSGGESSNYALNNTSTAMNVGVRHAF